MLRISNGIVNNFKVNFQLDFTAHSNFFYISYFIPHSELLIHQQRAGTIEVQDYDVHVELNAWYFICAKCEPNTDGTKTTLQVRCTSSCFLGFFSVFYEGTPM